jgi:ribosomal protein S18 acetylase RimI-like enzyme
MKIRKLYHHDYESIILIAKSLPQWFTKKGIRQIKRAMNSQNGFVAIDKTVVGFILYRKWKKTAWITWMGILARCRNRGIGTLLIRKTENIFKKHNIRTIKISTVSPTVRYTPYEETRKFYTRIGFRKHRIDKNFYKDGKNLIDRIVLIKYI